MTTDAKTKRRPGEDLSAWFGRWWNNHQTMHRHQARRPRNACKRCGRHQVSRSSTSAGQAARRLQFCTACYKAHTDARRRMQLADKPVCMRCGKSPVSEGKGSVSRHARAKLLCGRCYNGRGVRV